MSLPTYIYNDTKIAALMPWASDVEISRSKESIHIIGAIGGWLVK